MIKPVLALLLAGTSHAVKVTINTENQCAAADLAHADWMKGVYYFETENDSNGNYIRKGPEFVPKKQEGKKRIAIMGDSLGANDNQWGWTPHLGYYLGQQKLPFEVVNFARAGGSAAAPAMYQEGQNCYNMEIGPEKKLLPFKWVYDSDQFPRFANAKASEPDIVII